jgi:hypothetical protein
MMIFFRILLFILLINTLSTYESWILPRSTSFHHVLEFLHARTKISQPSFSLTLSSILSFIDNTTTCYKDLLLLTNGFINQEKWALKIVDSWGVKPPAGLLEGSHLWLGSYDECLHSLYLPINRSYVIQPYLTKYCIVSNQSNDDDNQVILQKPALIIGICLPRSCHSNDFQFRSLAIECQSERKYFSIGAIFTLSLIIILSLFVCIASFIPHLNDYSVKSTLKKLFSFNENQSTYSFLNGIRGISLLWIILGHSFMFQLTLADNIVHILDNLYHSYAMQFILGAMFAVDTFFFISGFLAVFVFINTFKNQSKLVDEIGGIVVVVLDVFHIRHLFLYYFHRYCRLIPTLVFVLLVSINLTSWMGEGPIFPRTNGFEVAGCRHQWWTTILFLNNLISPEKACLPVTW